MLSQAAHAWPCPKGEVVDDWWTDLLAADYLDVDYVDEESHERIAMWPLSDRNGWDVLPMVMSGRRICHALIPIFGPSRTLPFARVGLRPRGRRRLYAFRARLVDEPLRAAILRARDQVIHMGGDGAYRPVHVVRSYGSVRTLQVFIPELFKGFAPDGVRDGEAGCKTWSPLVCC